MALRKSFIKSVLTDLVDYVMVKRRWTLPDIEQLSDPSPADAAREANFVPPVDPANLIAVLSQYGIKGTFKDFHIGAVVTTYEIAVPVGTHLKAITRYQDDLARDLRTPSLRVIKGVKDASTIGFEIENTDRYTVNFKQMFKGIPDGLKLPVILGEDTYGEAVYADLTTMPHLLVAGQTGSGKSAFMNGLIATLISKMTPAEVQLLIVDPKGYEFSAYRELPHLYQEGGEHVEIASEVDDARHLLNLAVEEMERRGQLFDENRVKKLDDYNSTAKTKLPYIVFIVDEFADLMMMGTRDQKKDVETKIVRIAQKARAVGIHMVLATQKPLASIMTSLIKANMPARIAFSVTSGIDSRVILDEMGAETLAGSGDMLFRDPSARSEYARLRRVQAPWISDKDVETLIN